MKTLLASSLMLIAVLAHAADDRPTESIDGTLAEAARQHRPVLLDFHAVWCYSCYYMAAHVLNGPAWQAVQDKALVAQVDADSPEGQAWMSKLKLSALPSYVVLDEHGQELGRILAEQPRQTFYARLDAILAHTDTLDTLKSKAATGSLAAVTQALDTYRTRRDADAGLTWFAGLPEPIRSAAQADRTAGTRLNQLRLAQADAAHDQATAATLASKVLAGDPGCDRAIVLDNLIEASQSLPQARRQALLVAQRTPTRAFLREQVLTAQPHCADQRTAVIAAADLDAALGDHTAEHALLDEAITRSRQALDGQLNRDRNLADNLRAYLDRAHRLDELETLERQLIAAYPDDYVYAYRYGRTLAEQHRPADALPWLAQAAEKAYGANRLNVARYQVEALKALHRDSDAEKLVADALKGNEAWFPRQSAQLKASLQSS